MRRGVKANERDFLDGTLAGQEFPDRLDRDPAGAVRREMIDAGADRGEGDRLQAMLDGEAEGIAVAVREEFVLAVRAVAPDGADGVDDVPGGEVRGRA